MYMYYSVHFDVDILQLRIVDVYVLQCDILM